MKNEQSLHNWQFQSLKFQKLTKLVPERFYERKFNPRLSKVKYYQKNDPWVKILRNYTFGPWSLKFGKNGPRCFKFWKFIFLGPCIFHI